jgi:F0F1-type ATP synthase alpha subunit
LDKLEIKQLAQFEKSLYEKMDASYISLSEMIKDKQDLTPDIEIEIKKLLDELISEFVS